MRRAWWRSWARLRNSRRCAFSPRQPVVRWATGPMKALLWLSDTFRRLNPRERRGGLGGGLLSATALVLVLLGLPFAPPWAVREAAYRASREQWLRFAALTANTDRLRRGLHERKLAHAPSEARPLTRAAPPPAAAAPQGVPPPPSPQSSGRPHPVAGAGPPPPPPPR